MATSSIHIEAGKIGFFCHNDRSKKTKNSIFFDEQNFYSCSAKDAIFTFKNELELRTKAYLKNHPTRKKLHAKTLTHLSSIINLNKNHTEQDIKKICDFLEQSLGTKVLQCSIHRDEGHIDKITNEPIKNYHAHIEFMGLDVLGNSIRRKLSKKYLSNLQTVVASLLKMDRGINYIKEQKSRPKRLGTYEYKRMKEQETNSVLAKQKDLKNEITNIRAELQTHKATREQYKTLELLQKDLKYQIRNKDLTIQNLNNTLTQYRKDFREKKQVIFETEQLLNSTMLPGSHNKFSFTNKIKGLILIFKDLKSKVQKLQRELVGKNYQIHTLQQDNIHLKNVILETGYITDDTQYISSQDVINTLDDIPMPKH